MRIESFELCITIRPSMVGFLTLCEVQFVIEFIYKFIFVIDCIMDLRWAYPLRTYELSIRKQDLILFIFHRDKFSILFIYIVLGTKVRTSLLPLFEVSFMNMALLIDSYPYPVRSTCITINLTMKRTNLSFSSFFSNFTIINWCNFIEWIDMN